MGKLYDDAVRKHGQSDADKILLLIEAKRKLDGQVSGLERRLISLTDAIEDFLNDARERPAVEKLEQAMNDYGMRE